MQNKPSVTLAEEDDRSFDSVDVFPHQVGGHHIIVKHPTRADLIVKPYFLKEIRFYEDAQNMPALQQVISRYHGRINMAGFGECIVLEDLTHGMEEPCIMDMKIGRRLFDDDATPEKIERMKRKSEDSTSGTVGFRISGMRSLDPKDGSVIVRLKNDVRGLKYENLLPTMYSFFARLPAESSVTLIGKYLQGLQRIRTVVESSNGHFYSSSILFVYDHKNPSRWGCRMIDFVHSHIFPPGEHVVDENYLEGLANLMEHLRGMARAFADREDLDL